MNGDKSKKRTKSQKSKEPKKAKTDDEMVTVEVVESSELNEAMNHIFSLPDDGKSTGEKLLQSMEKIGALEESLNEEAKKQARFRQLMDFYKKQPLQVDMPVTQEWLEKTYGHLVPPNSTAPELATPPPPNSPLDPYSPVSLPPVTQMDPIDKLMQEITQEERDKANEDFINQGILPCPFHPCENVKCLNPNAEFGALYYRCPYPNCCVWFTSETYGIVLDVLQNITNKKLLPLFQDASLRCECNLVPNMKLSKSEKNYHKVYLCCGRKNKEQRCGYFQFTHWSPWSPKRQAHQPTMDDFFSGEPLTYQRQMRSIQSRNYKRTTPSHSVNNNNYLQYRPPQRNEFYRPSPNYSPKPYEFSPERKTLLEEPITRRSPVKEEYFRKSYNFSNQMKPASEDDKPEPPILYKRKLVTEEDDDFGWPERAKKRFIEEEREYKGKDHLFGSYRKDPWIQQFKREADQQEQYKEKRFLQECDANNAERIKNGMAPYSYETFKKFGTGIF